MRQIGLGGARGLRAARGPRIAGVVATLVPLVASAAFGTWSEPKEIGGILASEPAVVRHGESLSVFFRGTSGSLVRRELVGARWGKWEDLGGILTSSPSCTSSGSDRIDCVARGTTMAVHHKWWDGKKWSGWSNLGGVVSSAPSIVSTGKGGLEVFVRGLDKAIYQKSWDGSAWSGWRRHDGKFASAPACAAVYGRVDCFVQNRSRQRSGREAVVHYSLEQGQWSRKGEVGDVTPVSAPTATARVFQGNYPSPPRHRLDVMVLGADGKMHHASLVEGAWSFSEMPMMEGIDSAPACASQVQRGGTAAKAKLDCFCRVDLRTTAGVADTLIHLQYLEP